MRHPLRVLPGALMLLAATAWHGGAQAQGSSDKAGTSKATAGPSAPRPASAGTESSGSGGATPPVQKSIATDLARGKRACSDLTGKPREACEARAAATAESPRGRGAADPTGTGKPAAGKSGNAR